MSGDHEHHGPHPNQPDIEDAARSPAQLMAQALEELLLGAGIIQPDEMRVALEALDQRSPDAGARLVARSWVDPAFAERVLSDVNAAALELGLDVGATPIRAVTNTATVHNVIVCTLCSCYPSGLLGSAPDWYKSREYRSRVVREPRVVLAEFGTHIDPTQEVRVHDSTADLRYIVIPQRPPGTDDLDEEALAALVTRDCLIGTTVPVSAGSND